MKTSSGRNRGNELAVGLVVGMFIGCRYSDKENIGLIQAAKPEAIAMYWMESWRKR